MRIAVLCHNQTPSESTPEHFISKPLAAEFLAYFHNGRRAVVRVSDSLIWIRISLTFGQLKALLRPNTTNRIVPRILPPRGPENLLLYYPVPDQRSKGCHA